MSIKIICNSRTNALLETCVKIENNMDCSKIKMNLKCYTIMEKYNCT